MKRTFACLSALLVTVACVSVACGGKLVVEDSADAMSGEATASSTSGGNATASSTSGGGGGGGSSGGGGCDAASHTIDITDFNVTCTAASDCVPVFIGNLCTNCTCPLFSAINVADKMKYDTERQVKEVGTPPAACFCPASHGICVQGQCATQVP